MNLKKLFLSLTQEDKDKVCALINEVGIGTQVGTLEFRQFLKQNMHKLRGNAQQYIKYFSRLDKQQQELFYNAMVNYDN